MKDKRRFLVIFCVLIISSMVVFPIALLRAQNVTELKNKIDTTNSEIEKLENEINAFTETLKKIGGEKDTLARAIKELDITAKKLAADIRLTEKKIASKNLELENLTEEIGETSGTIITNEDVIAKLIRDTNEKETTSLVFLLVDEKTTLGETWTYIDENMRARGALLERVEGLRVSKTKLEENKSSVEIAKEDLSNLQKELRNQKKVIDANTKDKTKLLKETKNEESKYNALVKEKKAKKAAFEKELEAFEAELSFILDPSSIPSYGSKIFSWPVTNVKITQLFGRTVAAKRLYVSGTHSGIDFGAPIGTPVKSVFGGTVVGTGNTDLVCPGASYGNWVLIRHDNGLSTAYAHLSVVAVASGQRVAKGETIAYSGSTGYSTGPHLHLSLFASSGVSIQTFPSKSCGGKIYTMPVAAKTAYLDPLPYFGSY